MVIVDPDLGTEARQGRIRALHHDVTEWVSVPLVPHENHLIGDAGVAGGGERRVGPFQLLEAAGGGRRRRRKGHVGGPARSAGRPAEWVGGVLQRAQGDLYVAGAARIRGPSAGTEAGI